MVGIVIVSHSHRIAEGVAQLAREMGGADVKLETAGGLEAVDGPDGAEHPIGTDAVRGMQAIDRAWSEDGVLVLMDLGSAVLSAEMAVDLLDEDRRGRVVLTDAPLVEGAVAAAVTAKLGLPLEAVVREARSGLDAKASHLAGERTPDDGAPAAEAPPDAGDELVAVLGIDVPHGLHARPAARFVQTAAGFDARIRVRNHTTGAGPADATSLNGVATLGVREGHEVEIRASGPEAADAIEALEALAARRNHEPEHRDGPVMPTETPDRAEPAPVRGDVLVGAAASPGLAVGPSRLLHTPTLPVPEGDGRDHADELAALDRALRETADAIVEQRRAVATKAGEDEARIFDAHLLFLRDEALLGPARAAIRDEGRSAARAWRDAVESMAATWAALEDEYMRARAVDLQSVGDQVLARILGADVPEPRLKAAGILVAADLTPADTARLDPAVAHGIATARGGPTSHAAVIARALGIPAVVGAGPRLLALEEGSTIAIDGAAGEVLIDPAPAVVADFEREARARSERLAALRERASEPVVTVDGVAVEVAANVGRPEEVAPAVEAGADGIGLFRTEFLFMERSEVPDEHEQEAAYRAAAEALDGRPLLVRTLDAGADKPIAGLPRSPEPNPFLGVRGIRLGLEHPELLEAQLRAVCRVALDHPMRIMFPMVATTDELAAARAAFERARAHVEAERPEPEAAARRIEVGIMVEVPSGALMSATLAADCDFFSIGTNDLTQYAMAADRGNEHVAGLNDPLHPAVLRLIATTVEGAETRNRWVGVCGEVAGDELAAPLLLGLGVRELSMAAPAIAAVKEAVRSTSVEEARKLAVAALTCTTAAEVRAMLSSA